MVIYHPCQNVRATRRGQKLYLRAPANRSLLQNSEGEVGAWRNGQLLTRDNVLEQPEKPGNSLGHRVRWELVAFPGRLGRAAELPRVLSQPGHVVVEGWRKRDRSVGGQILVAKSDQPSHFSARNFVTHLFGTALLRHRRWRHTLRRASVQAHEDHVDAADSELGQGSAVRVSQAISLIPGIDGIKKLSLINFEKSDKLFYSYLMILSSWIFKPTSLPQNMILIFFWGKVPTS